MREKLLIILILLFALAIRLYKIGQFPFFPFSDEYIAANSVLSYLNTGRDLNGQINVYFYNALMSTPPIIGLLLTPLFLLFGPNVYTIRLPTVIFSILSIYFLYKLATLLTKSKKVGLLSAFLLSLIPWHFHFSRFGVNAISSVFFLLAGIYFLLLGRTGKKSFLIGMVLFGLSLYSYSSAMITTPLFVIVILLIFSKDYLKNKKILLVGIVLFLIISTPLAVNFVTDKKANERPQNIFVFKNKTLTEGLTTFTKHYLEHYSISFLFVNGDPNIRHNVQNHGELYPIMAPFIILGLVLILKKRDKTSLFILFWLLFFPLPSALTDDGNPHATRSLIGSPLFCLLSAYAIVKFAKPAILAVVILVASFNIYSYFNSYFNIYPYSLYSSNAWGYGNEEVFNFLKQNYQRYQKICVNYTHWYATNEFILYYFGKENYDRKVFNNPNPQTCKSPNSVIVLPANNSTTTQKPIKTIYGFDNLPLYNFYEF